MTGAPDWQRVTTIAGIDLLSSLSTTFNTTPTNFPVTDRCFHQYQGFYFIITGFTDSLLDSLAVQLVNVTQNLASQWQVLVGNVNMLGAQQAAYPLLFPIPASVGDQIEYKTISHFSGAGPFTCNVYGLASLPLNAPKLRPDGRLPVQGSRMANGSNPNGETLVAAPGTPWAVLVKSAQVSLVAPAQALSDYALQGTIGGALNDLAVVTATVNGNAEVGMDFGDGILLDVNTPIVTGSTAPGQAVRASISYDLVV
ncbi:MAG TPA: hypothetical protein VKU86_10485 [Acidimicrobiales bacterium]|nr:hypothetical protein [Acidimicrobiales bacterium]